MMRKLASYIAFAAVGTALLTWNVTADGSMEWRQQEAEGQAVTAPAWIYATGAALTLVWEANRLRRVMTPWVALRAVFVAALWPLAWLARAGDMVLEGVR